MLYLVPASGLSVRDPETYVPLPAEGAWKPRTQYWLRRLAEGDVFEAEPPTFGEEE